MLNINLYMLQRITAIIMAPLVLGHIAVMIYAIRYGLSATEILGRTQGSIWWLLFYGSFVAAVSVHAAIGLRVIVFETLRLKGLWLSAFSWSMFILLSALGFTAVYALTLSGVS